MYCLFWEKAIQTPSPSQEGCFHLHQNQIIKESPSQNHKTLLVLCYNWMKPPLNATWFPHKNISYTQPWQYEEEHILCSGLKVNEAACLRASSQSFSTTVSVLQIVLVKLLAE